MRKTIMFIVVTALVLFVTVTSVHSASLPKLTYYEAAIQFSDNTNPNGTWSYGFTRKLGGSFTSYTINGFSDSGDGWYGYTLGETPMLVTQGFDSHYLYLHPGPSNEPSVARWTAPSGGTFNFFGNFYGFDPDYGSDVYVLKNNVSVYHDTLSFMGDQKTFSLALTLRKGDKIDFVVATLPGNPMGGGFAGVTVLAAPQLFHFTSVEFPGVPNTGVFGLNNLGDIVGRYRGADNVRHGFIRHKGVFTTIDYPGAAHTYLISINDLGQILGYTWNEDFTVSGSFLYSNGTFTDLSYPGAVSTVLSDINDLGYITGYYDAGNYMYSGFVRSPDANYFSFEVPGSCSGSTTPSGMNLLGQIAGSYLDASCYSSYGFLRNPNGKFTNVSFPGAVDGTALYAINGWGGIEGSYCGLGGPGDISHCQNFVAVGSDFVPVWLPGTDYIGTELSLDGINDRGQVVAWYLDANNAYHSFTGTPIVPLR
jgi:probable HAF family extracellular repeat protein